MSSARNKTRQRIQPPQSEFSCSFPSPLVTTATIEILVLKAGLSLNFFPAPDDVPRHPMQDQDLCPRIIQSNRTQSAFTIRLRPRPIHVLIWVKKPVRRNYFPFAVVSRASDFFS